MNNYMDPYPPSTENGDRKPPLGGERQDEPGSVSGSDEGSSAPYTDTLRNEADFEDDSDALTNQTLNADGTPKRPMNAFMIFARRRRPQVSAENQAMRTGEISKILSKEWAIMPPSEKQYYLDRAKQLKESFNSKYPDYVYRRRPNNSRKKSKRRQDTGMGGPGEHGSTPEANEELGSVVGDYGDMHTDADDRQYECGPNNLHSRLPRDAPQYIVPSQGRTNPYPYVPSDSPYRTDGSHDLRIPFVPSHGDRLSDVAAHRLAHPEIYSVPPPGHPHSSHVYSSESAEAYERWDSRVGPGRSGWMATQERSMSTSSQRYSSTAPAGWSGGMPSGSGPPPSSSTPPGNFAFPTLTSPFYPNQAHLQGYQPAGSPSHPDSPARYDSPSGHSQQSASGRDYETHNYNASPSMAPENPYPQDDAMMYHQRLTNISRGLPSVQSLPNYTHSPHSASSGPGAPQGY
ncbi:hypothetical protein AX17_005569 [Amanita inopinata Kibby_2008]|nr:hypothetical protein AX17_005569 [Amanita inopinata Kibby_2008]